MNPEKCRAAAPAAFRLLTIRVAAESDVDSTLTQLSGHMNKRQRRAFRDKLERYVRKPDRDLIIAVSNAAVVGFCKAVESADEWAIGLNYTVTQNLKAFTNYTVTQFDGGASSGGGRDDEKALFARLQLNY